MRAIMKLRNIGINHACLDKIDEWIKDNTKILSIESNLQVNASSAEYQNHIIKVMRRELGAEIAEHQNSFPRWVKSEQKPYLVCRMEALVIKNEFGE